MTKKELRDLALPTDPQQMLFFMCTMLREIAIALAPEVSKPVQKLPYEPAPCNNSIFLNSFNNKIATIKLIRELTGMGLKEAKEYADQIPNPSPLLENLSMLQAKYIARKFEEIGTQATIRSKGD